MPKANFTSIHVTRTASSSTPDAPIAANTALTVVTALTLTLWTPSTLSTALIASARSVLTTLSTFTVKILLSLKIRLMVSRPKALPMNLFRWLAMLPSLLIPKNS